MVESWYASQRIVRFPSDPGVAGMPEYLRIGLGLLWHSWLPCLGPSAIGLLGIFCAGQPGWRFLIAMSTVIAAGMLFFSPYAVHWALGVKVPLVIAPVALATAILTAWLTRINRAGIVAAAAVVLAHIGVQYHNVRTFHLAEEPSPHLRKLFGGY